MSWPRHAEPGSRFRCVLCGSLVLLLIHGAVLADESALFVDRAAEWGLDFVHFNGMTGERYLLEITGAGGGFLDFDNDGDLDLYLVQGRLLGPNKTMDQAVFPPRHPVPTTDQLYRNDLTVDASGRVVPRFVNVTSTSGIRAEGYGMGLTTGDIDNDGSVDLYVSNFGSNQLWRNNGDGTFEDFTTPSATDDPGWSVPASFFDFDRDGWLDLFVGNYVLFDFQLHTECPSSLGTPGYCGPLSYSPQTDNLFRNLTDGRFANVSSTSRIDSVQGNALGSVVADFDLDGWLDLYLANDQVPNALWMNQRDGTFRNRALLAGCAVNREGRPEASMGVDAADIDGDGDEDLFMGHLTAESNTLYLNDGTGLFSDETHLAGLGNPSWNSTTFGTVWLDYDLDGRLDVITVNGAVLIIPRLQQLGDPYPLHQPNQLFHNNGDGTFEEVSAKGGEIFEVSEVSRGAVVGDVDNDGDPDVLITNNAGPARLLINELNNGANWVGLRLVRTDTGSDWLASRAGVFVGDRVVWQRVRTDGSFASARDPRLLVGLGESMQVDSIIVNWPDGATNRLETQSSNAYLVFGSRAGKNRP